MFRENKEFAARDVFFIICPSGGAKDGLSDLKKIIPEGNALKNTETIDQFGVKRCVVFECN